MPRGPVSKLVQSGAARRPAGLTAWSPHTGGRNSINICPLTSQFLKVIPRFPGNFLERLGCFQRGPQGHNPEGGENSASPAREALAVGVRTALCC